MENKAVIKLAELVKAAAEDQVLAIGERKADIEASASAFVGTDLADLQSDKEDELRLAASAASESIASELVEFETEVSKSIALVVENPSAAIDSLKEIKAELEEDKAEIEALEVTASTELSESRAGFLTEFGEVSEFVLSFDGAYTPSDASVADSYNAL